MTNIGRLHPIGVDPFFRVQVYERVVMTTNSFKVDERVRKSVILVYKKAQKGQQTQFLAVNSQENGYHLSIEGIRKG